MSEFPADFHVTFSNGKIEKYKGDFDIDNNNGVLHVVSTAHHGTHFWFSPSAWLSIQKLTPS